MKTIAPERLASEILSLLTRIDKHCRGLANAKLRHGLCVVHPKQASLLPPSEELIAKMRDTAHDYFTSLGATGFLFQFIGQPELTTAEGEKLKSPSFDDYQLMCSLPHFDERAEAELRARALLYCHDMVEVNGAWDEWFSLQHEAIRLTTNFYQGLVELAILGNIRLQLSQPWANVFEFFVRKYIGENREFLVLSNRERQLYRDGKKDWKQLYPKLSGLFPRTQSPLIDAYKIARKKALESRNSPLSHVLRQFTIYIENTLVEQSQLPFEVKTALLKELKDGSEKKGQKIYSASRPTICLSDIECAQMLLSTMQQFIVAPRERAILGEIILFIFICQHAAFSNLDLKIEDILGLSVLDVDCENHTIRFSHDDAYTSGGLAQVLRAWMGPNDRNYNKLLLPLLNQNYDKLEKRIRRLSVKCFGVNGRLQPRDFLAKVHVIPGARIPIEIRKKIDEQMELIKDSPYRVNTWQLQKHIRDSYSQTTQK